LLAIPIANASSNIAVGAAGTFRMGPVLAGGIEVTSVPEKLGEYRPLRREANDTTYTSTSASPTTGPSATDGILIYGGNGWGSIDTVNQPSRYDVFVGKNKQVKVRYFSSTGLSGDVDTNLTNFGSTAGYGVYEHYDPNTGVLRLSVNANAAYTASNNFGLTNGGKSTLGDGYAEIWVSESVQQTSFDPVPNSEALLHTGLGHGSTGTAIRTHSVSTTTGNALTITQDTTNGDFITVNESGLYHIECADQRTGAGQANGISINAASSTTSILTLTRANGKRNASTGGSGILSACSWTERLSVGDVIRHHTDGTPNSTTENEFIKVTKVAS